MKELMDERKPICFEELEDHMEKYDELLYEQQGLREQQRELREHEMEIIASKRPKKGRFHSLIVDKSTLDERSLRSSLLKKKN